MLDGVESAIAQATPAGKGRSVTVVGGAGLVQELLRAVWSTSSGSI
ncbi:MAG TPA: hypothetical protein VIX85_06715 [Acidimicrobiales bacterium]